MQGVGTDVGWEGTPMTQHLADLLAQPAAQQPRLDQIRGGLQPLSLPDELRAVVLAADDDHNVAGLLVGPERGEELQPIENWHVNIQQDDIRFELSGQLQAGHAV